MGTRVDLQIRKGGGAIEKRFKTEDVRRKNYFASKINSINLCPHRPKSYDRNFGSADKQKMEAQC